MKLVQDTGTKRIYRFLLRHKWCGCFAAFTEADLVSETSSQVIEYHQILAVRFAAAAQCFQAVRHADDPSGRTQARMPARQRNRADHFTDAHGRQAPVTRWRRLRDRLKVSPDSARSAGFQRTSGP